MKTLSNFSLLIVTALLFTMKSLQAEELVTFDGKIAEAQLPLDKEIAEKNFETAIFGIGWFWQPDSEFGSIKGVLRVRVGYCGGKEKKPTYRRMADHTEAIAIDYDPALTSYSDLLKRFWRSHSCDGPIYKTQYMNAIFYLNEKQRELAEASLKVTSTTKKIPVGKITTKIVPAREFTYAERYHQKYYVQRDAQVRDFLSANFKTAKQLADSTVAARLNAYLSIGKDKDWKQFQKELPSYGLPENLEKRLSDLALKNLKKEE